MPRLNFHDPYKRTPDSFAAARWGQVRARIATMNGPFTATTPSMIATSAPESNSKLDQALKDLEIDHGVHCDPQFSTNISNEDAPAILSMLRSETKEGPVTLDLLIRVKSIFFRRSDRSTIQRKPYDAWTINPPKHEQFVIHASHTVDHELDTASISYSLAADATWNNKFQRGVPGLLRSAKVFDVNMRCSQILTVTFGTAELSSLQEQWIQQAGQELSKQLSMRRANAEEDRWVVLTRTRYYGYLISGLNLEIHEMVYRPDLSRPSMPTEADNPVTFTTSMIKSLSLECTEDIVKFSAFHRALMKWAQVRCCAGFVENVHQLCWQPSTEKSGLWKMTDEECHRYWDSAVPRR